MGPDIYKVRAIGIGSLALMPKPVGGEWVAEEFEGLAKAGLSKIVSLLEIQEARSVGLADEQRLCEANDLEFVQFPICDRGTPEDKRSYIALARGLHEEIVAGAHTAVHCRAGIGRAGVLATSILVCSGLNVEKAFAEVSEARRVTVPDTDDQIEFVISISNELSK